MQRLFPRLLVFALLAAAALVLPRGARVGGERSDDVWLSVRSENFLVEGRARERELRRVAARLEEYRAAFSNLFPGGRLDSGVPVAVVVFPDDASYAPFKPLLLGRAATDVAGYFQPGADINYITLVLGRDPARDPSTLLHEYTHLLVDNHFRAAPLWLKEGLAEFYSTARLSDGGRRLTLAEPPPQRVRELRRSRRLIPLAALFAVDQASPYYTEAGARSLFYAQSWALVHYLSEGRGGERGAGLARFNAAVAEGAGVEEAMRAAFGAGVEEIEAGLAAYVTAGRFRGFAEEFARPLDFETRLSARALSDAEVSARLGDLLSHTGRDAEAEGHLTRALELDARLARARVSLGALRVRQGRHAEARELLRRAAEDDPQNHLAHYHLADALHREGPTQGADSGGVTFKEFEERTAAVRAALGRALELAPGFVESYRLLATVELESGESPSEAAALLRRATALAPRRADLALMLAQAEMLGGRFDEARRIAEPFARRAADERIREQAASLLARVESRRRAAEAEEARAAEQARAEAAAGPAQPCDLPAQGGPHHKRLRFKGSQVCGRLAEIECEAGGVILRVETSAGTLRLRAEDLRGVRFVTYTAAVKTGALSCGPRERADHVLVTYRTNTRGHAASDGEAVAVEFIPDDWKP